MLQNEQDAALVSVFALGDALFGIPALEVQEVVQLEGLTLVHHAHETISGILNLRGQIVTVFDLAKRVGMQGEGKQHILIVRWQDENIGLLVDKVLDVLEADLEDLQPPPANVSAEQQQYFKGVCKAGGWLVALLDLDKLLTEEPHET